MVLLSFSTTTSLNTIINTPSFPCFFVCQVVTRKSIKPTLD